MRPGRRLQPARGSPGRAERQAREGNALPVYPETSARQRAAASADGWGRHGGVQAALEGRDAQHRACTPRLALSPGGFGSASQTACDGVLGGAGFE